MVVCRRVLDDVLGDGQSNLGASSLVAVLDQSLGLASMVYLVAHIRCMLVNDPRTGSNAFELALQVVAAPEALIVAVAEIAQVVRTVIRMGPANALNNLAACVLVRALLFPCCLKTTHTPCSGFAARTIDFEIVITLTSARV